MFGLEYDLDLFNIVAVDDFNMGAMENKSLNIFNSRLVLADADTATDMDFERIEGVVGRALRDSACGLCFSHSTVIAVLAAYCPRGNNLQ